MVTNLHNKNSDMEFRDRIDNIKQIADPVFLLEQLGFEITRETSKEARASCKVHGGDNTTSFRLNKDLKTWTCFTHKCQEGHGNDIFGLVMAMNNCKFIDALDYLEEMTGSKDINREKLSSYRRKKEQSEFVRLNGVNDYKPSIVDPIRLKYYKPYRSDFFLKDGFNEATLDYFEIAGGYSDNDGLIRDIIPIYDTDKQLVAYSLRDIRTNVSSDQKYKLTPGFDKDKVLYNLCNCKELLSNKPLIIVEGFKSVWRLYELGIYNVVACMGSSITTGQAQLLFTHANNGAVLFLDNDLAGATGIGKAYELLKGKLDVSMEVITEVDKDGKGLDPADLNKEQIFYYLKNYI